MATPELFYRFGVALVIGFLIGLQREYAREQDEEKRQAAGVRTFSLIGLTGCAAGLITDLLKNPLGMAAAFLLIGSLICISYYLSSSKKNLGMTTEVAAVITFMAGALCYWGYLALAVAIAVVTTALLSFKWELHSLARALTREDIYAALKFGIISLIVLPVLPNQNYGPSPVDVLNPYKIWLFVVFVSGISFLGYVLIKVVGGRQGIGLTGLLGGMVSSTAVTVSFSRRSQSDQELAKPFALAVTISWAAMFLRVGVIVAVVNFKLFSVLWLPLLLTALSGLIYVLLLYRAQRAEPGERVSFTNPFELGPAIKFGLFYAVILLVSRAAQVYLGAGGVYASSLAAGLADLNAISLSLSELSATGSNLSLEIASRGILLACLANNLVKQGVVMFTGSKPMRQATLPGFLLMTAVGALAIIFLV